MVRLHPAEKTKSQSSFPNEIPIQPAYQPWKVQPKEGKIFNSDWSYVGRKVKGGRALMCSGLWITETNSYCREMQPEGLLAT